MRGQKARSSRGANREALRTRAAQAGSRHRLLALAEGNGGTDRGTDSLSHDLPVPHHRGLRGTNCSLTESTLHKAVTTIDLVGPQEASLEILKCLWTQKKLQQQWKRSNPSLAALPVPPHMTTGNGHWTTRRPDHSPPGMPGLCRYLWLGMALGTILQHLPPVWIHRSSTTTQAQTACYH